MDLLLDLTAAPGTTLRRRAEHALREAVRSGRLPPGTRLPATRALAAQLGVSRGVVVEAYAQLAAEGYLRTRRGGGTTVAEGAAAGWVEATAESGSRGTSGAGGATDALGGTDWAGAVVGAGRTAPEPMRHDLRPALPALAGFPRGAWLASVGRVLRSVPDERLGYPDPAGVYELRETLAAYLGRVRGVRATPQQIVVTSGLRQGLDLLWTTLGERGGSGGALGRSGGGSGGRGGGRAGGGSSSGSGGRSGGGEDGDRGAPGGVRRVAFEQPGWRGWSQTAEAAGLEHVPLAIDRDGADVDGIAALGVDAVGVTPAHQFPTGAVLSAARRSALVAWAQAAGGLIVEDDYDAEFRYDRKPIGSLQGLAPDLVVYGGSASKTLAPAVRIGWLVLPRALVAPVREVQRRLGGAPAPIDQLALADFVERGELDRHLRRQRRRYRRQRDALLAAVARELPEVAVEGAAAGLHAVLRLPPALDEQAVLDGARARGVALDGLGHGAPALVVGYANLTEPAVAPAVAALAEAVRAAGMRRGCEGVR